MVLLDRDNRLLTGSADSELHAWDIRRLEEVRFYPLEIDTNAAFHPLNV